MGRTSSKYLGSGSRRSHRTFIVGNHSCSSRQIILTTASVEEEDYSVMVLAEQFPESVAPYVYGTLLVLPRYSPSLGVHITTDRTVSHSIRVFLAPNNVRSRNSKWNTFLPRKECTRICATKIYDEYLPLPRTHKPQPLTSACSYSEYDNSEEMGPG